MADDDAPEEYTALVNMFGIARHRVLEVETLPSSITPPPGECLLVDGDCIGVPKKALVKAFLYAAQLFRRHHTACEVNDESYQSTAIILLFDPEHLTAANYRKHRLLSLAKTSSGENLIDECMQELSFLDTILTSPLHRQSKSPTLWFHRWWLLKKTLLPLLSQTDVSLRLSTELKIVLRSGERHANNYYAFQHARRMLSSPMVSAEARLQVLNSLECEVLPWCMSHPSDVSGWTLLNFVLLRSESYPNSREGILKPVIDFVDKTQWRREALWSVLRTVSATEGLLSGADKLRIDELHHQLFGKNL